MMAMQRCHPTFASMWLAEHRVGLSFPDCTQHKVLEDFRRLFRLLLTKE
jgi:inhibitor of KinA sporulation pathway (predicted exonuclease)